MEMTTREIWTLVHGMGFGGLYLLACSFAIVDLYRHYRPRSLGSISEDDEKFLARWLVMMAVIAWMAVLSGTFVIYPWYRAVAPVGTTLLTAFPQAMLKSNSGTIGWHTLDMEWKEHVAWFVPISITMAATVFSQYRRCLRNYTQLRAAVLIFVFVSFASAGIAGFFVAELNKHAPVDGGGTMRLMGKK